MWTRAICLREFHAKSHSSHDFTHIHKAEPAFGFSLISCLIVWNVQWMETEVEKRMRRKPSVLRKLSPFCPLNAPFATQKELVGNNRFSELLNFATSWCFRRKSACFFRDFPSFRGKLRTFVKKSRLIIEKTSEEIKIPSDEKEIAREEKEFSSDGISIPRDKIWNTSVFGEFRSHFPKVKCWEHYFPFPRIKKTRTISPPDFNISLSYLGNVKSTLQWERKKENFSLHPITSQGVSPS